MNVTTKRLVRDAAIIAGNTLVLLVVLELLLRLIRPELATDWRSHLIAYEANPHFGIELRANVSKEYPRLALNGGEATRWSTNSHGFRGEELAADPEYRIVVYGDSNVQARFSNDPETFAVRLEERLTARTGVDVEVVNAGVVGFGPDQSVIRLGLEADALQPDLALLHVFADNDFGDIVRNRLLELADGELVPTGHPVTLDKKLEGKLGLAGTREAIRKSLAIRALLREFRKSREPPEPETRDPDETIDRFVKKAAREWSVYANGEARQFSHFADHYDIDIAIAPDSDSATEKLRLMESVLRRARDTAAEHGFDLLVVIQPSVVDLSRNSWFSYEDLGKYPEYDRSRLTAAVAAICARNDIDFVDLYADFAANEPDALFFRRSNNHWNDAGQDLAARVVTDHMADRIPTSQRQRADAR